MVKKIDNKIITAKIVKDVDVKPIILNKKRPYILNGRTYSVKTRLLKHTLYVTINNIEENDTIRPFEIFFKSKDSSKYMELDIFSKLLSSSFRKESNICYLVDDMKSTNSNMTSGGYFRSPRQSRNETKGKYIPSIYYEIAEVIEDHLLYMGIKCDRKKIVKIEDVVEESAHIVDVDDVTGVVCPECGKKNVQMVAGCKTCYDCTWSACS